METLKELVQFLQPNQRLDLKVVALQHVLGLTGTAQGKKAIYDLPELLAALFTLVHDANHSVAKDSVLCLINLTAEDGASKVYKIAHKLKKPFAIIDEAVTQITDKDSELADPWTMVLSNLTRSEELVDDILSELNKDSTTLDNLMTAFVRVDYNNKKAGLHYLAPIFCNLTQSSKGRELFCQSKYQLLEKVLPFTHYEESLIRRGGTIGILKNICFDPVYHGVMMKERDVLVAILYPLCGPEDFSDEENEKFPIELQYLPETKTREEDPDLRKMLLECLLQLCATRACREWLRAKGAYEILREYHKWEAKINKDAECLLACENVVDILIKKEEEIGVDNYKEIEVPQEAAEKFVAEDEAYLKDII